MMKRKPPKGNVRRVQAIDGNQRYTITNKGGQTQQVESHLERKLALKIHRDKLIKDYYSQPETYHFIDDTGCKHRYTPDFKALTVQNHVQIHEVTIAERRDKNPNLAVREKFGRELCEARGWQYFVHTPETLPNDTETANLLAFYAFRATSFCNPLVCEKAIMVLKQEQCLPLTVLFDRVHIRLMDVPQPIVYMTFFHMVWHEQIKIDWNTLFFAFGAPIPRILVSSVQ